MSETPEPMTLPADLAPLAEALKSLKPATTAISRDRVLFEAGRASAAPRRVWLWPSGAAFFAAVSLVLAAFLIVPEQPGPTVIERVRIVEVRSPVAVEMPEPPAPPLPSPSPSHSPSEVAEAQSGLSPDAVQMAHLRNDILRWGVDMLPASKPFESPPPSRVEINDLDRWLEVPLGTFTAPNQKAPRLLPNIFGVN